MSQSTVNTEVNYTTSKGDFQIPYPMGNYTELTSYILAFPMIVPISHGIVNRPFGIGSFCMQGRYKEYYLCACLIQ